MNRVRFEFHFDLVKNSVVRECVGFHAMMRPLPWYTLECGIGIAKSGTSSTIGHFTIRYELLAVARKSVRICPVSRVFLSRLGGHFDMATGT